MSSNEELNENSVSQYELLFNRSSYKSEWDKKSPERSSILSLPPDEINHSQEQFGLKSNHEINSKTSASSNFLPTLVRFEPRAVSFEVNSPSNSTSYTDSLEESNEKTLETGESEEQTETEEDSLESTQITEQELDNVEGCEKEDGNPVDYLDKEVFPVLLPCLEKMLFAAKDNDVLKVQKSRFNGLDYLAELLWNCNPLHPERHGSHLPLFDIPFAQEHLEENPRPIIPQSWLWTRDQAAVVIQAGIRGYLVRCQPQVQELREFWKTLAEEKRLAKQMTLAGENLEKEQTIDSEGKHLGEKPTVIEESCSIYSFYSLYSALDGKS